MRQLLVAVFNVILLGFGFSQASQDIEIIEEQGSNSVTLYGVNNTLADSEVSFRFETVGFVADENSPVKTTIGAKSKVKLVTLTAPANTECRYSSSISIVKSTKSADAAERKAVMTTSTQMNLNKINIFTRNGCGRCEFAVQYLTDNHIPFVELNTSIHEPNNDMMWSELEKANYDKKNVQMPVIVTAGRTYYNIESLPVLLKSLK